MTGDHGYVVGGLMVPIFFLMILNDWKNERKNIRISSLWKLIPIIRLYCRVWLEKHEHFGIISSFTNWHLSRAYNSWTNAQKNILKTPTHWYLLLVQFFICVEFGISNVSWVVGWKNVKLYKTTFNQKVVRSDCITLYLTRNGSSRYWQE